MEKDEIKKDGDLGDVQEAGSVADGGQTSDTDADKKSGKKKDKKLSKSEKSADRDAAKEKARLNKEWEDSIVASKKVKSEENRRKVKRAMLFIIVFALIVTSLVYVMLLFVQENNVRITASSNHKYKTISLSMDNELWSPFIKASGPSQMQDLSYNIVYQREEIPTVSDISQKLSADQPELGNMSGDGYIAFGFMLRNDSSESAYVQARMGLDYNDKGLQNAIRVMWGEARRNDEQNDVDVKVYAALSHNERLADTNINVGRTLEQGFIEYCSYPFGSQSENFDLTKYEREIGSSYEEGKKAENAGYFATEPFESSESVFEKYVTVESGEIIYYCVVIWIEGSDFECVDNVLGGYVKLDIDFVVLA